MQINDALVIGLIQNSYLPELKLFAKFKISIKAASGFFANHKTQ